MFGFLKRSAARWDKRMPFAPDGVYVQTRVVGVIRQLDFSDAFSGSLVLDQAVGFVDRLPLDYPVALPLDVTLTQAGPGDDVSVYRRVLEDWVSRGVPVVYAQRADGLCVFVEEKRRGHWLMLMR